MIDATTIEAAVMRRQGRTEGAELRFLCPAHDDHHPSARYHPVKQVWTCDACGAGGGLVDLAKRLDIARAGRNGSKPTTAKPPTLAELASHKKLPVEHLVSLGWHDLPGGGVGIPYRDRLGNTIHVKRRVALVAKEGSFWPKGEALIAYGEDRLDVAVAKGYRHLVEGETDTATLQLYDEPVIGVPGAQNAKTIQGWHMDGIGKVYVWQEPGSGGAQFVAGVSERLKAIGWQGEILIVSISGVKDVSELHIMSDGPDAFRGDLERAMAEARPISDRRNGNEPAETVSIPQKTTATAQPPELARSPRILDRFASDLARSGLAGETRAAKLLYLIITSRLLERPTSAGVKGPSSGGKSFLVEKVLSFFPASAYYALSAMSEKALAYSQEPLSHRFLVVYEAAGMNSDMASYLIRSLLSEGKVRYETVERGKDGLKPRLIEREGPTGLIVTTTAVRLHPENETRMLSIVVNDTKEQTRDVLLALAGDGDGASVDLGPWHAIQTWLDDAVHSVTIPFATTLAGLIPPIAVRLRRDFGAILTLIRAHAILHQTSRECDPSGRILANFHDYAAVRELIVDLVAEGIEATVSTTMRETVQVIAELAEGHSEGVTVQAVARQLKLDKATALRRVRAAIDKGYIQNAEERRGRPARLLVGDPLPEELEILPSAGTLQGRMNESAESGCRVAVQNEGIESNPQAEPF